MNALEFVDVTKTYGHVKALDGVTFSVDRGEMFGLIGPDGAGKTTAIRIACGLLRPSSGTARLLGFDPVGEHGNVTGAIGYLSQRFSLYGDLTIDENIAFFAELHHVRNYGAARDRLLDMTQLTPFRARRADRLSGGMKQKLALACTLVHEPQVLILDEPTTGVDPVARREFWKLLSEFLARGLTIVMSTPYLDEAERCGRVLLLHEGRVLAIDRPRRTAASPHRTPVRGDHRDAPTAARRTRPYCRCPRRAGVRRPRARAGTTACRTEAAALIKDALVREGIAVGSVRPIGATLEDVFIGMLHAH